MANISAGSVVWQLDIDNSKFNQKLSDSRSQMNEMESASGGFGSRLKGAFGAVGKSSLYAAAGIGATAAVFTPFLKDAASRVDTLKNSARTFDNMGFSSQESAKAIEDLNESILGLPTPLDSAIRGMTSLAATYGDVQDGQKIFTALNNAILGFGGTAAEVDNAILQLSQLPMDGPLDAQTWRSLRNSGLTPVLVAMAKDMGMGVNEMKEAFGSGELSVKDFTERLKTMNTEGGGGLKSLEQIALDSTKGIGTSFANLKTAVVRGIATLIEAIGSERIAGVINSLSANLKTGFQFIIDNADTIAVFVGTILATAFGILAVKVILATYPIILIAGAVAGLYLLFKKFKPQIMAVIGFFQDLWNSTKPVRDFIGDQLVGAFEALISIGQQLWTELQPLIDFFKAVLANKTVQTVLKVIGIAIAAIVALPFATTIALIIGGITVLSKVLGFIAKHFQTIKKVIVVALKVALAPFVLGIFLMIKAVQFLIKAFKIAVTVISTVLSTIAEIITTVFQAIWDFVSPILNFLFTVWRTIFFGILLVVVAVVYQIYNVIVSILQAIWGFVAPILSAIYNFFKSIFTRVFSFVKAVLTGIFNFYKTIFTAIFNTIKSILSRVWSFISSIWNRVYGFLSGVVSRIWNRISSGFNSIYSGVRSILGRLINFVGGIGGRVLRAIGGFGSLLYNKGRDLIQGLINGAGSLLRNIGKFFLDKVPGWIQGPFKKALGISSPSKMFAGFGENLGQGLIKGIEGTEGAVKKAVGGLSDATLGGFESDIALNAIVPTIGDTIDTNRGNTNNQNVTIDTVVLGDRSAVQEFFDQLNQDTLNLNNGLTPIQGN